MADTTHSVGIPARKSSVPLIQCTDSNQDAPILAAFAQWQAALVALNSRDLAGMDFATEQACWKPIDLADTQVHDLPALTPAGVACKLYIALFHNSSDAEVQAAAIRADLAWLVAQGDQIDWELRVIVSALVALKSMEG